MGRRKVSKAAEMERQSESERDRDRERHQGGREERRSEREKWF